ncbi:MAG: hypothetical protein QOG34_955 [Frankiaceae bacterium]|jgi:hypothetical protein|nr:hypothetical protein [Frankiaceae bacterium]
MRRRIQTRLAIASAVVAASVVPASLTLSSAGASGSAAAGRVTFATPVVVSEFTPGYEPDIAIDKSHGKYRGSGYVSMPEGFTTTESYIWRSDDRYRTFHPIEGTIVNKTATCAGGGDTELQVDPVSGEVYFADLQGLTNFSNSASTDGGHTWTTNCAAVNGVGVDRQWEAVDSNGGTAAVGAGPNDGRLYFDYDNIERNGGGGAGGNQLVMNESLDGVHFGAACAGADVPVSTPVGTAVSACPEPPAIISPNETIPGNILVDNNRGSRFQHRVYAIHTGDSDKSVVMSYCSGKPGDKTAAQVAASCTDPTVALNKVNPYWHDSYVRPKGTYSTGQLFASAAMDTAGNLYATWSEYPGSGQPIGPGAIKVATSTDGGAHWSNAITVSPRDQVNTVMPWIVAGDKGRIGVAWYGSKTHEKAWGPDPADHSEWSLYYASSVNALSSHPSFSTTMVTEPGHYIKYGDISTGGFGGSQDRSLGDFFEVQSGPDGQAVIVYVDETSNDRESDTCGGCGQTPPQAAGPIMVAVQNGGPGLYAHAKVPAIPNTPGSVRYPNSPAFLSSGGQDVAAPNALKVVGASVRKKDATHLTITLQTADPELAKDLRTLPPLGGPVNNWLVRWAAPNYKGPGDGNIFFVGMESDGGANPSFYTGTTQHVDNPPYALELVYQPQTKIYGTIQGSEIIWTVPLSAIGNPKKGNGLFSITGFTDTQQSPAPPVTGSVPNQGMEVGNTNLPNQISSTPAFDYWVK